MVAVLCLRYLLWRLEGWKKANALEKLGACNSYSGIGSSLSTTCMLLGLGFCRRNREIVGFVSWWNSTLILKKKVWTLISTKKESLSYSAASKTTTFNVFFGCFFSRNSWLGMCFVV